MTQVSITRVSSFDAAHFLAGHKGKCARMHGHTYRIEVEVVRGGGLDMHGMVMDFGDLDEVIQQSVIDPLDHRLLNDILSDPTAERIALYALERIQEGLPSGVSVRRVRVWETPDSYAEVTNARGE